MNKLEKKTTADDVFVISFDSILPTDITIDSINSIIIDPTGLTYSNESITTEEVDDIPAGRGIIIRFANGDDGYEYHILFAVAGSDLVEYEAIVTIVTSDSHVIDDTYYYGTVWQGDDYFANRLNTDPWDDATNPTKRIALVEATRLIDRLAFKSSKTSSDQPLQFPRNTDTEVPLSIEHATYEIALQLLNDIDPDIEADNLSSISFGISSVRSVKDTDWLPEHKLAGIPSGRAWNLIKPFLIDARYLKIKRTT